MKKSYNLLGMLDADPEINNFYFRKYRPEYLWYGDAFGEKCHEFLESYFDGKAKMDYRTEERKGENTRVKTITSNSFEEHVMGTSQCVVEIFKNDCDACHYNGRMFDILSQKMHKHGYLDQIPLYRMNLDNVTPYLGRFLFVPQHIHITTKDGKITELKTMRPLGDVLNCATFLEDLKECSKIPIDEKVKIDSRKHIVAYADKKNLSQNFNIDFDLI